MARRVQFEVEFEVGDDTSEEVIESIMADALVQIDEAVDRSDETTFNEVPVETKIAAYALTIDGNVAVNFEAPEGGS